jgi:hypothetical protein
MSLDATIHNERTESRAAQIAGDKRLTASQAAMDCFKAYAKEHPEVLVLWAFGIGFVLGWKLKPW